MASTNLSIIFDSICLIRSRDNFLFSAISCRVKPFALRDKTSSELEYFGSVKNGLKVSLRTFIKSIDNKSNIRITSFVLLVFIIIGKNRFISLIFFILFRIG